MVTSYDAKDVNTRDRNHAIGAWIGRGLVTAILGGSLLFAYDRVTGPSREYRTHISSVENAAMLPHTVRSGENLTCYRKFEGLPAAVRDAYESVVISDSYNSTYRPAGAQGFGSRPLVPDPNTLFVGTTINLPDVNRDGRVGCQK